MKSVRTKVYKNRACRFCCLFYFALPQISAPGSPRMCKAKTKVFIPANHEKQSL